MNGVSRIVGWFLQAAGLSAMMAGTAFGQLEAPLGSSIDPAPYIRERGPVAGRYEHALFDVYFYEKSAQADLFIKEEGVYKTNPLRLYLYVFYHDTERNEWLPRRVTGMARPPVYEKGQMTYALQLEEGVIAEAYFHAQGNQLAMGYTVEDPRDLKYDSQHMLRVQVLPMEKGSERSGELVVVTEKGKTERYGYMESVPRFASPLESWEIQGAVFGGRVVSMKLSKKGAALNAYIYPGLRPVDGYQLNFTSLKGPSRAGLTSAPQALLTVQ